MSRGPGKAQRALLALLADGPRTLAELGARVRHGNVTRTLGALAHAGRVILSDGRASLSQAAVGAVSDEPASLTFAGERSRIYTATWRALLAEVPECDALICDPPYSARTHAGHDGGAASVEGRRALGYGAWGEADVSAFVAAWAPRTRGWFVALTDHTLAPAWQAALAAAGRYVFTPVACVMPGRSVRLRGDGPSSVTDCAIVARPKRKPWSTWGTTPGEYRFSAGRMRVVGGKPLSLMRALVADYTREGDLVCDPTCGGGTTLRAAVELGRRAVGGDVLQAHAHLAAAWLAEPVQQRLAVEAGAPEQLVIVG